MIDHMQLDDAVRRLVNLTHVMTERHGSGQRGSADFLLACLWGESGYAHDMLESFGLSYEAVDNYIQGSTTSSRSTADHPRPFSGNAQKLLDDAQQLALDHMSGKVSPAHVILAMLQSDSTARKVLVHFNVPLQALADTVNNDISARSLAQAAAANVTVTVQLEQALATCRDSEGRRQVGRALSLAQDVSATISRLTSTGQL